VVARVRALLRRTSSSAGDAHLLRVADLEIDLDAHTAHQAGQPLSLTPTEFSILAVLADQPGRVFSRLQLLEATQGAAFEGYERTIDAHIKNLRAKLAPDSKEHRYIETVFGVGYRFARE
jgi:DNA-binding response OmpR family regulator